MLLRSKDQCLVTGNLPRSRGVELRTTQTGRRLARFSIRASTRQNEDGSYTDLWINCVAWGGTVDIVRHLHPGQSAIVGGTMRKNSYTSRDGELRENEELTVDFALSVGPPSRPQDSASGGAFHELPDDEDDGELPF